MALVAVSMSLLCAEAHAASQARRIETRPGDLRSALDDVARQAGIELLYGPGLNTSQRAPQVRGIMTPEAALARLLEGSGLGFRKSPDGAYLLFALPREAPTEPEVITTVPEILVLARKTQNVDIARHQDDIQPYQVWTGADFSRGGNGLIDDALRGQIPSNAQKAASVVRPQSHTAGVNSEISLRGLPSDETLVLVDGRRLPGLPDHGSLFQGDINGIPMGAIDRVEVLPATAGGIFGSGATGGAVNIVLKRDYQGGEAAASYGATTRGDAPTRRAFASLGHTFADRLRVMISASQARESGLSAGNRAYDERARLRITATDPTSLTSLRANSDAYNVISVSGENLSLRPELGGQSLGSNITYAPLGQASPAAFLANAGKIGPGLSSDARGAYASLRSQATTASLILNTRLDLDVVEIYADAFQLESKGRAQWTLSDAGVLLAAGSPFNPFAQDVQVVIPIPGYGTKAKSRALTRRVVLGALVRLPRAWSGTLEATEGQARISENETSRQIELSLPEAQSDPFSPDYLASVSDLTTITLNSDFRGLSKSQDVNLRLAGPLLRGPAGPVTLSLLAESRTEALKPATDHSLIGDRETSTEYRSGRTQTRSLYGELRAPLARPDEDRWWLRGLETQFALRQDWIDLRTRPGPDSAGLGVEGTVLNFASTSITAGAKVTPRQGLMLRASFSTGALPPTLDQLQSNKYLFVGGFSEDPRRPGERIGEAASRMRVSTGGGAPKPEQARTFSAGVVLTAHKATPLRVSLDYTRIEKRQEIIIDPLLAVPYYVAREANYPDRVTRGPLTPQDQAKGFLVGPVTAVDATGDNIGRTTIDAVDLRADYQPPRSRLGQLRLSAALSWLPRYVRLTPTTVNLAGKADGPLKWRGNIAADLSRGDFDFSLSAYYYDAYAAAGGQDTPSDAADLKRRQGGAVRAQTYLDLTATWRPSRLGDGLTLRLGVQNLLDSPPPLTPPSKYQAQSYSTYGDVRGRRFELTATRRF